MKWGMCGGGVGAGLAWHPTVIDKAVEQTTLRQFRKSKKGFVEEVAFALCLGGCWRGFPSIEGGIIGHGNSTCKDVDCEPTQGSLARREHRCVRGRSEWGAREGLKREGVRGRGVGEGSQAPGLQRALPP